MMMTFKVLNFRTLEQFFKKKSLLKDLNLN